MQKWPNCRAFVTTFGKPDPTNHEWLMGRPIGWTDLAPLETGNPYADSGNSPSLVSSLRLAELLGHTVEVSRVRNRLAIRERGERVETQVDPDRVGPRASRNVRHLKHDVQIPSLETPEC